MKHNTTHTLTICFSFARSPSCKHRDTQTQTQKQKQTQTHTHTHLPRENTGGNSGKSNATTTKSVVHTRQSKGPVVLSNISQENSAFSSPLLSYKPGLQGSSSSRQPRSTRHPAPCPVEHGKVTCLASVRATCMFHNKVTQLILLHSEKPLSVERMPSTPACLHAWPRVTHFLCEGLPHWMPRL